MENEISEFLQYGIELDKEEDALLGEDNSGYEIDLSDMDQIIANRFIVFNAGFVMHVAKIKMICAEDFANWKSINFQI